MDTKSYDEVLKKLGEVERLMSAVGRLLHESHENAIRLAAVDRLFLAVIHLKLEVNKYSQVCVSKKLDEALERKS